MAFYFFNIKNLAYTLFERYCLAFEIEPKT